MRASGDGNTVRVAEIDGVKVHISKPSKSLKSAPGATKRRAKIEKEERERFGLNLAVLANVVQNEDAEPMDIEGIVAGNARSKGKSGVPSQSGPATAADLAQRWKALREHIKLTNGKAAS